MDRTEGIPTGRASDAAAKDLLAVAEDGLSQRALAGQIRAGHLRHLLGAVGLVSEPAELAADRLIAAVDEAVHALGASQEGESARALFGVDEKMRSQRYPHRIRAAWEPFSGQMTLDSFRRRRRDQILKAVIEEMRLAIVKDEEVALPESANLPRLPAAFERLPHLYAPVGTEIERVVDLSTRLGTQTIWRRTVVPAESGLTEFLVRGTTGIDQSIEFIDETVAGVSGPFRSHDGRTAWRLRLSRPTERGERLRVNYLKRLFGNPAEAVSSDYISLRSPAGNPLSWLNIDVEFAGQGSCPQVACKFVNPIGSLPSLVGQTWRVPIVDASLSVSFDLMTDSKSHGLYWWFEADEFLPSILQK